MKLNLAYPNTGQQKMVEFDDDRALMPFFDKRMGSEVPGESLGDEFKGYVFKITGGNDKQGFPMKQGVLTTQRVSLLLTKGQTCYRPRRTGERKRKSVRGCIVSHNLSVLALTVSKKGDQDIPGLTDHERPRRLGPKRAKSILKLFDKGADADVRKLVIRRTLEGKKKKNKAPKIQRLVTDVRLERKRREKATENKRRQTAVKAKQDYETLVTKYRQELKSKRMLEASKKKKLVKTVKAAPKSK